MSTTCKDCGNVCIRTTENTTTIDERAITFCPDCLDANQADCLVCGNIHIPVTQDATTKQAHVLTLCYDCNEDAMTDETVRSGLYAGEEWG